MLYRRRSDPFKQKIHPSVSVVAVLGRGLAGDLERCSVGPGWICRRAVFSDCYRYTYSDE